MQPESDIDLFVVRPADLPDDAAEWRDDLDEMVNDVTSWTGNDARVLELGESEVAEALTHGETVMTDIYLDGIRLRGRPGYLRPAATG